MKERIIMEEKIILKEQDSFNLKHIFECGQCFRWNEEDDGSWIGIIKDAVIRVKKENQNIAYYPLFIFKLKKVNLLY